MLPLRISIASVANKLLKISHELKPSHKNESSIKHRAKTGKCMLTKTEDYRE